MPFMRGTRYALMGGNEYPGAWIAPTWTRDPATGLWTNVPVAGDELYANGDLSTSTGWIFQPGWTYDGVNFKATFDGVTASGTAYKSLLTIGQWFKCTYELLDYISGNASSSYGGGTYGPSNAGNGVYTDVNRAGSTAGGVRGLILNGSVDNISFKLLPLSQILAYRNYGRQASIATAFTRTTGIPGGVVSRLSINPDGTFNYVMAWHDGTNLHLDTVVNSYTVVSLVNAAAAYGAGRIIKINFSAANTAQAFYNGVQIGTDQDISAVPAGTYAGLFLTGSGTLGDPVVT